jgi:hypothetical protein
MKDTRTKEQKQFDRKQEIMGTIMGIYMRHNHMKPLPIDEKTLNEIADNIAPSYVPLSQADYDDFKAVIRNLCKPGVVTPQERKVLKNVLDRISLFG